MDYFVVQIFISVVDRTLTVFNTPVTVAMLVSAALDAVCKKENEILKLYLL